jgi:hypothetical protein
MLQEAIGIDLFSTTFTNDVKDSNLEVSSSEDVLIDDESLEHLNQTMDRLKSLTERLYDKCLELEYEE